MPSIGERIAELGQHYSQFRWVKYAALGISLVFPSYFIYESWAIKRKIRLYQDAIGDKVFMDISIGGNYAGRVLIGLYSKVVPLTCENFLQLCKGYQVGDKVLGFKNTPFHLVKPGACVVGGDVLEGSGRSRGLSIYGESFPDENFEMEFLRDGDLAMINWGKNTNSSFFMITLSSQRQYYGHHVVFGTVIKGMKTVREMGELGTNVGKPVLPIHILQCGVVEEGQELPPPPTAFLAPEGPMLTEDEFREQQAEKRSVNQPS